MSEIFRFRGLSPDQVTRFNEWINSQPDLFPGQEQWLLDADKGHWLGFNIHQPAKGAFHAMSNGDLILVRRDDQANLRTRLTPMFPGQRWRYLRLGTHYHFTTTITLSERQDDYRGVRWANLFEIWGPYDNGDEGKNPSLEVQLKGEAQEWIIRQRGDSRPRHGRDYETVIEDRVPFEGAGKYTIEVSTVLDYEGNGMLRVWINGALVSDHVDIQTTYNSAPFGDGMKLGGICHPAEIYTPDDSVEFEPIVVRVHDIQMEVFAEEESSDSSSSDSSISTASDSSGSSTSVSEGPDSSEGHESSDELSELDRRILLCVGGDDEVLYIDWELAKRQGFKRIVQDTPL